MSSLLHRTTLPPALVGTWRQEITAAPGMKVYVVYVFASDGRYTFETGSYLQNEPVTRSVECGTASVDGRTLVLVPSSADWREARRYPFSVQDAVAGHRTLRLYGAWAMGALDVFRRR